MACMASGLFGSEFISCGHFIGKNVGMSNEFIIAVFFPASVIMALMAWRNSSTARCNAARFR